MKITYREIIQGIVTLIGVTMLFSCEGNLNEVRALQNPADAPAGIANGILLKYTDSGRVVATLQSEKMFDFTSKDFVVSKLTDRMGMRLSGPKIKNLKKKIFLFGNFQKGSISSFLMKMIKRVRSQQITGLYMMVPV